MKIFVKYLEILLKLYLCLIENIDLRTTVTKISHVEHSCSLKVFPIQTFIMVEIMTTFIAALFEPTDSPFFHITKPTIIYLTTHSSKQPITTHSTKEPTTTKPSFDAETSFAPHPEALYIAH